MKYLVIIMMMVLVACQDQVNSFDEDDTDSLIEGTGLTIRVPYPSLNEDDTDSVVEEDSDSMVGDSDSYEEDSVGSEDDSDSLVEDSDSYEEDSDTGFDTEEGEWVQGELVESSCGKNKVVDIYYYYFMVEGVAVDRKQVKEEEDCGEMACFTEIDDQNNAVNGCLQDCPNSEKLCIEGVWNVTIPIYSVISESCESDNLTYSCFEGADYVCDPSDSAEFMDCIPG